jgi:sigma-E factor negative regulatory protein RseC
MSEPDMLEESARVVGVEGDSIWVETASRSGCSQCASSNCTTSVVAKLFGVQKNRLLLKNPLQAKAGDHVVIGVPGSLIAKASVLAYLTPLIFMLGITLMASALGINDAIQSLLALAGLAIGLLLVRWYTKRDISTPGNGPQLLKVVENRYEHVVFPKHTRS